VLCKSLGVRLVFCAGVFDPSGPILGKSEAASDYRAAASAGEIDLSFLAIQGASRWLYGLIASGSARRQ